MRSRHYVLGIYLLAIVVALDQVTKHWAHNTITDANPVIHLTNFLNVVLVKNRGVTFGLLNGLDPKIMPVILGVTAFLILVFLGRWLWKASSTLVALSLGAIMGGAIGNVIDRIHYGAVIDFLDFYYRDYHWYAFNVADAAIVTGVFFLVIDSLVRGR